MRITSLEVTARRRATTIVIDNHRVFLIRIEMGREIVTPADRISTRVDEIPCACLTKGDVSHLLGV